METPKYTLDPGKERNDAESWLLTLILSRQEGGYWLFGLLSRDVVSFKLPHYGRIST